jgi:hypothetical protein
MVWGFGFSGQGYGLKVKGAEFRVEGNLGCLGFRV